jgi:hypothetical protein
VFRSNAHWRKFVNSDSFAVIRDLGSEINRPELGHALREDLYAKVSAILRKSDQISDSDARLLIQASCLDLISALEDLIQQFGLDRMVQ